MLVYVGCVGFGWCVGVGWLVVGCCVGDLVVVLVLLFVVVECVE